MSAIMTVECPACDAAFPVDPAKVPEGGARTQCTVCETQFRVDAPASESVLGGAEAESWMDESGDAAWATDIEDASEAHDPEMQAALEPESEHDPLAGAMLEVETDPVMPETGFAEDFTASPEAGSEPAATEMPSDADDPLADWVVETEETPGIGALADDLDTVDRLETVEEEVRVAGEAVEGEPAAATPDDEFAAFSAADEVMLTADDLGGAMGVGGLDDDAAEDTIVSAFDDDLTVADELSPGGKVTLEEVGEAVAEFESTAESESEIELVAEVAPEADMEEAAEPEVASEPAPAAEPEPAPAPTPGFQFGRRDPHEKARRLARVLVSDMITYNPERHATALERSTLKEDFDEEIGKSWAEYVEQVGQELAGSTSYWTDALNEILARGEPLF